MNEITIQSIDDLHMLSQRLDFHIFRGQRDNWLLKSKLFRTLEAFGIEKGNYRNRENNLIKEFQSRVRLYKDVKSLPTDNLGCYSLMQHFGAPTRFLDFTSSMYVAAFFAVEDVEHKRDSFIWCLNEMMIRDSIVPRENISALDGNNKEAQYEAMREIASNWLSLMDSKESKLKLLIIDPSEKDERISRQQGLFVCPLNIGDSIEDILIRTYGCEDTFHKVPVAHYNKVNATELALRIRIPSDLRQNILKNLNKMNVNHEVLFPGLDGFCKSMYLHVSLL